MQQYVAEEYTPGSDVCETDDILDFIRRDATTISHPTGTARMGHNHHAVVDDALCVHGINGLRIADRSVMPTIVSGNTNAAAIMIAEKAADLILAAAGHDTAPA